jgi:hypothetical protein
LRLLTFGERRKCRSGFDYSIINLGGHNALP